MFTGLIDSVGDITVVKQTPAGIEVTIGCRYHDLVEGESIAINGVCLTVREFGDGWFTVGAVVTTTGRTTVGDWKPGRRVNIERAMRAGGRFGGHIVQGHVDAVAGVTGSAQVGDAFLIDIELPSRLSESLVLHGSVTIDGVSLTVNQLDGDKLQVSIIDYTFRRTTLGAVKAGDRVHVETDVIGKYVQRVIAPYMNAKPAK